MVRKVNGDTQAFHKTCSGLLKKMLLLVETITVAELGQTKGKSDWKSSKLSMKMGEMVNY